MSEDMRAYVIYSFDLTADASSATIEMMRPKVGEWVETEGDDQYEFDYLADECGDENYRDGRHRKYVAELTETELAAFVDDVFGYSLDEARERSEPTMGSITEFGHLPAYSLNAEPMDWNVGGVTEVIWCNAYVTDPFAGSPLLADDDDGARVTIDS